MTFVSIIVPTMRVGGFDILMYGLQNQTYKNFELIIVDGIYNYRNNIVKPKFYQYNFPIIHVLPFENKFPLNTFCRYSNTAISHCNGELVLFITDYSWLPEKCVQTHVEYFEKYGHNYGLMCPQDYKSLPVLHDDFCSYINYDHLGNDTVDSDYSNNKNDEELEKYVNDLESGKLNNCMWSIFKDDFIYSDELLNHTMTGADPRLRMSSGPIEATYCPFKNDSCALDKVLEINGYDEEFDGSHCYQDTEFASRLSYLSKVNWNLDTSNVVQIINPRFVFPYGKRLRKISTNQDLFYNKFNNNFPAVNSWSLREANFNIKRESALNKQIFNVIPAKANDIIIKKHVCFWFGARKIQDKPKEFMDLYNKNYNNTVIGNRISDIDSLDYYSVMKNFLKTDILVAFDEPWAVGYIKANYNVLFITDISLIPTDEIYNRNSERVNYMDKIICQTNEIKQKFLEIYNLEEKTFVFDENYSNTEI